MEIDESFGMGLGIPAVEQFVNRHSGKLAVASVPGHGTTFNIVLPHQAAGEAGETLEDAV